MVPKAKIEVDFLSVGMDSIDLGHEIPIALYRLVQEALNNVRKHAEARKVTLRLVASFPSIILMIEDDGKGFEVGSRANQMVKERSIGLRSMEEQVTLLGGTMRLDSKPKRGTRIQIQVPLRETKNEGREDCPHCGRSSGFQGGAQVRDRPKPDAEGSRRGKQS